jgi:predicted O-methyltransferase YrrM
MAMKATLRRLADGHGFLSVLLNLRRVSEGYQPIFLDYPVRALPRYGYGKPQHPELTRILAANDSQYAEVLSRFLSMSDHLLRIPLNEPSESPEPCWRQDWLDGLDIFALYGFIATGSAKRYLEIGSGYSTKLVRRAIKDHALTTTVTSVDPHPRTTIDSLCDEVVRRPLEECDLGIFDKLESGDILFMDGSHRSFMNSDVTVFFLEIFPRLKPGVLVHLHDIFLPLDYPPYWEYRHYPHRYWSEQYLLATSLLAGHNGYEIVLPNHYVSMTQSLAGLLDVFWKDARLTGVPRTGSSFWMRIC